MSDFSVLSFPPELVIWAWLVLYSTLLTDMLHLTQLGINAVLTALMALHWCYGEHAQLATHSTDIPHSSLITQVLNTAGDHCGPFLSPQPLWTDGVENESERNDNMVACTNWLLHGRFFGRGPIYCPGSAGHNKIRQQGLTVALALKYLHLATPPDDRQWHGPFIMGAKGRRGRVQCLGARLPGGITSALGVDKAHTHALIVITIKTNRNGHSSNSAWHISPNKFPFSFCSYPATSSFLFTALPLTLSSRHVIHISFWQFLWPLNASKLWPNISAVGRGDVSTVPAMINGTLLASELRACILSTSDPSVSKVQLQCFYQQCFFLCLAFFLLLPAVRQKPLSTSNLQADICLPFSIQASWGMKFRCLVRCKRKVKQFSQYPLSRYACFAYQTSPGERLNAYR